MAVKMKDLSRKLSIGYNLVIPEVFQNKYIPSLNGLRAVAIIVVIITHLQYTPNGPHLSFFLTYIANGGFGVQIFFVISGFLITGLLLKEQVNKGSISLGRFYTRRAIRIFPVFYLYIGFIIMLKLLSVIYLDGKQLVCAAFYLQDFAPASWKGLLGHTWSLAVEEQFYLCWPLILVASPNKYYFAFLFVVLYNILLRPYFYLHQSGNLFLLKGFLIYAPAILMGSVLYIAMFKNWLKNIHHILMHPFFGFSLVFATLTFIPRALLALSFFSIPFDYIVSSLFIALFIYYVIHCPQQNILFRLLNFRFLNLIGILSYSIYIWQQVFLVPSYIYTVYPWWTIWPQNILYVLAAASLSYYFVEKPILKYKSYFQ
jgi:peptidoglycan/LPS O-acetylase OafA/YrhL